MIKNILDAITGRTFTGRITIPSSTTAKSETSCPLTGIDLATHLIDRHLCATGATRPVKTNFYIKFAIQLDPEVGIEACNISNADWQRAKQEAFPAFFDGLGMQW